MKVKARKNLIYKGAFYKAGEVFNMTDEDAASYERRNWVFRPLKNAKVGGASNVPNALPPLAVEGKKKK